METFAILAFIAVGAGLWWIFSWIRIRRVRSVAEDLGLEFQPTVSLLEELDGCGLMINNGDHQKCLNCFGGEAEDIQFCVFEYQYTQWMGRQQKLYSTTVAYINLSQIGLPDFHVQPKSKLGGLLGGNLINTIKLEPGFSNAFNISAIQPTEVRSMFTDELKNWFHLNRLEIEVYKGKVLIYRFGKTVPYGELKQFLNCSLEMMMILQNAKENPVAEFPYLPRIPTPEELSAQV